MTKIFVFLTRSTHHSKFSRPRFKTRGGGVYSQTELNDENRRIFRFNKRQRYTFTDISSRTSAQNVTLSDFVGNERLSRVRRYKTVVVRKSFFRRPNDFVRKSLTAPASGIQVYRLYYYRT